MHSAPVSREATPARHRPTRLTVFTSAFVAGAAVAFGVNSLLDVHLAQTRPQVECEPIFVALHSLPQGAPITVWDVALKDWPRAMLPSTALRARDTFEGMVLRHPLREGQPLLSVQLVRPETQADASTAAPADQSFTVPLPATPATQAAAAPEADLWAPAAPAAPKVAAVPPSQVSQQPRGDRTDVEPPAATAAPQPTATADGNATDTFTSPEPAAASLEPASPEPVITAVEPPAPQPVAVEPAGQQPTLADVADPSVAPTPGLLPPAEPLYAPVPASPPADLAGRLAGIGGLPNAGGATPPETGPSVLKESAIEAAPQATPEPARQAAGRYLVVPERIALQADASFAPPPQPQQPPAVKKPQPLPATAASGKPAPTARTSSRATPKRPQPPATATPRQAPPAATRPLGGMFPSLSAGFDALRKPMAAQPSPTTR